MKSELSEFLLGMYFNVSGDDIEKGAPISKERKQDIAMSCARRAYQDFNRTLRFNSPKDKARKGFRDHICGVIVDGVPGLLTAESFDGAHHEICLRIIEEAAGYQAPGERDALLKPARQAKDNPQVDPKPFYYGQAQKWLNMTLKYMWLLGLWDEELEHAKPKLHVPVDSYILKAAAEFQYAEGKNPYWLGVAVPKRHDHDLTPTVKVKDFDLSIDEVCDDLASKIPRGCYLDNASQPWSKWSDADYLLFQRSVRNAVQERFPDLTPVDWEARAWLLQSRLT